MRTLNITQNTGHATDHPATAPRDTVGLVKRESSQELGMGQEELDSRLQELEKLHQANLNDIWQTLIINEKKQQEKHHEPVSWSGWERRRWRLGATFSCVAWKVAIKFFSLIKAEKPS